MTDVDVPVEAPSAATLRRRWGPMRPSRLVSVRARRDKRLSAHLFRAGDMAALVLVTAVLAEPSLALLSTPSRWGRFVPGVAAVLIFGSALRACGGYTFPRRDGLFRHLARLLPPLAAGAAGMVVLGWLTDRAHLSVEMARSGVWTAGVAIAMAGLHTVWWTRVGSWRADGSLTANIAIIGATVDAERLIKRALTHQHVNVLGVFDDRVGRSPTDVLGVPVLGTVDALLSHEMTPYLDRIVVALPRRASLRLREIATRVAVLPNDVSLAVRSPNTVRQRPPIEAALTDPRRLTERDRRAVTKRRLDLIVSLSVLVLAAPVLLLVAALIKLDSPGPIFFRQRRHGFNNEEILVWKFRSMRDETADPRAHHQVVAADARVTRVGRFLRNTSLDEIPQLINVVRGEMSLVGPRPHAIGMHTGDAESAALVAGYAHRHRVKPGITGWAAVNGSRGPLHSAGDVARRVELDLYYIAHQSTRLDLAILLRTLPAFLGDRDRVR